VNNESGLPWLDQQGRSGTGVLEDGGGWIKDEKTPLRILQAVCFFHCFAVTRIVFAARYYNYEWSGRLGDRMSAVKLAVLILFAVFVYGGQVWLQARTITHLVTVLVMPPFFGDANKALAKRIAQLSPTSTDGGLQTADWQPRVRGTNGELLHHGVSNTAQLSFVAGPVVAPTMGALHELGAAASAMGAAGRVSIEMQQAPRSGSVQQQQPWFQLPGQQWQCEHCGSSFSTYDECVAHEQAVHPTQLTAAAGAHPTHTGAMPPLSPPATPPLQAPAAPSRPGLLCPR